MDLKCLNQLPQDVIYNILAINRLNAGNNILKCLWNIFENAEYICFKVHNEVYSKIRKQWYISILSFKNQIYPTKYDKIEKVQVRQKLISSFKDECNISINITINSYVFWNSIKDLSLCFIDMFCTFKFTFQDDRHRCEYLDAKKCTGDRLQDRLQNYRWSSNDCKVLINATPTSIKAFKRLSFLK